MHFAKGDPDLLQVLSIQVLPSTFYSNLPLLQILSTKTIIIKDNNFKSIIGKCVLKYVMFYTSFGKQDSKPYILKKAIIGSIVYAGIVFIIIYTSCKVIGTFLVL